MEQNRIPNDRINLVENIYNSVVKIGEFHHLTYAVSFFIYDPTWKFLVALSNLIILVIALCTVFK